MNEEKQWDDKGTGYVSHCYLEKHRGLSLVVMAEADSSTLLESKIQPDTPYQKQQETLIVWSEGDNYDLALSFQEKAGCDEIWERICQVNEPKTIGVGFSGACNFRNTENVWHGCKGTSFIYHPTKKFDLAEPASPGEPFKYFDNNIMSISKNCELWRKMSIFYNSKHLCSLLAVW